MDNSDSPYSSEKAVIQQKAEEELVQAFGDMKDAAKINRILTRHENRGGLVSFCRESIKKLQSQVHMIKDSGFKGQFIITDRIFGIDTTYVKEVGVIQVESSLFLRDADPKREKTTWKI